MRSWRITKYNPDYRNESGQFTKDEWTSFCDIGKIFSGEKLDISQYIKTEDAYVEIIMMFMRNNNISNLKICSIEKKHELTDSITKLGNFIEIYSEEMLNLLNKIKEEDIVDSKNIPDLCRLILREHIWCKLENMPDMFVHFGYDYYMYIGSLKEWDSIRQDVTRLGLFIEDFDSPYIEANIN